jgi:ABC-2 type transport system permease protein
MSAALRAEWTKLRSVRSTTWAVVGIAAFTVVLGAVVCSGNHVEGGSPGGGADNDVAALSLSGAYFGQVAAVVLGALAICSEYATGTIRATFAANPRRHQVLGAKIALVGALALAVGAAAAVAAFYIGRAILHGNGYTYDNGYPAPSLTDGTVFATVAGSAVYLAALALLSLGAGVLTRHAAGAISAVLGLLFAPWIVSLMLPEDVARKIQESTPLAGLGAHEPGAPISAWTGVAVTAAWAAAALLAALWLIRRRDA